MAEDNEPSGRTIKIPKGMVLVPDNDWAFMARVVALPENKKRRFYEVVQLLFFDELIKP